MEEVQDPKLHVLKADARLIDSVPVVVENPRAVQSAAMTATKASAGRREMTGLQLSPGLILL